MHAFVFSQLKLIVEVHPGHKSLNWLTPRERENAIKQFKEELLNIAGVDTEHGSDGTQFSSYNPNTFGFLL